MLDALIPYEEEVTEFDTLEGLFVNALVWSCGAAATGPQRARFAEFLGKMVELGIPEDPYVHLYSPE